MATTNYERVGKALNLLKEGLYPFVERELQAQLGKYWVTTATASWPRELAWPEEADSPHLDVCGRPAPHVGAVERGLPQDPGPRRAQPGQRAARRAQPLGAPGALLQRRRLPRAGLRRPAAEPPSPRPRRTRSRR